MLFFSYFCVIYNSQLFIDPMYSYQEMVRCWLEDPSKRPSFTELREKFEAFSKENHLLIHFPKNSDVNFPNITTVVSESPVSNIRDSLSPDVQSLMVPRNVQINGIGEQDTNLLHIVGTGMRRILSEPILEGSQNAAISGSENEGSFRKRLSSNPYVSSPRRPNSQFLMTTSKSAVWNQETL